MEIRERQDGDLPALGRVLEAVHAELGFPVVLPRDPAAWIGGEALAAFVAVDGHEPVGHVCLKAAGAVDDGTGTALQTLWSTAHRRSVAECVVVARLFVAPSHGGAGVGGALLDAAVALARERDLAPCLDLLPLDAEQRPSDALQRWYERRGWREAGTASPTWRREGWPPLVAMTLRN